MNRASVSQIVNALLYEGYILYPYRPSIKNRQRWTFGGLCPEAYSRLQGGSDAWNNQTECLVHGSRDAILDTTVRFLHLTERLVGEIVPPLAQWPEDAEPPFRLVETLRIDNHLYHTWQEAVEREISMERLVPGELLCRTQRQRFAFPGRRWLEPLCGSAGEIVGVLVREQQAITGSIEVTASPVASAPGDLFKVAVRVLNHTAFDDVASKSRDNALLRSLVSTNTILGIRQGEFVSLLDPPEPWRAAAADCCNVGTWPVLIGEPGQRDAMLSSPIILYDYPQVAQESPGDLFDGTEIDEILTLRILTLTDEEKQAAAALDGRARELLARTEALAREELMGLHGTVRGLRPVAKEDANG